MESAVEKQSHEMRKLVVGQERLEARFKKERMNSKKQITELKKRIANTSAKDKADKIQVEGNRTIREANHVLETEVEGETISSVI